MRKQVTSLPGGGAASRRIDTGASRITPEAARQDPEKAIAAPAEHQKVAPPQQAAPPRQSNPAVSGWFKSIALRRRSEVISCRNQQPPNTCVARSTVARSTALRL